MKFANRRRYLLMALRFPAKLKISCQQLSCFKGAVYLNRKDYLKSKIRVPKVPHKLLPRNNITAIINSAALEAAVCFVAPYGYGKTLAVASWLSDSGRDAVWLTLDAADDSEQVFFASLSAAMLRFTRWQGDVNDILSDPNYIENPQDFLWDAISSAQKSGREKILVLDDFGFIRDNALLRSIKNVISELLGRWRVVIMSRAELPPVFAELVLRGKICLITPKELSFSPEEIADFFVMNGCTASEEDALRIRSKTEGWPASLNVIFMISRGGPAVYNEAAHGYLMVFFETEIWNGLEDNIKDFLLRTSILDKLTPAGCRTVSDIGATLPILQWLFVNGLFISKLDEKDTYYYHRVFRDFLLSKLAASDIDEQKLYQKLGWQLFDNGEITRAFSCFFKAGDLYGISQVLRIIQPSDMGGGIEEYLKLTSRIVELDITMLKPYPVIVAKIALVHFLMDDIERMQSLYGLLIEWRNSGTLALSSDEYMELTWEIGWLCYLDPDEPTMNNKKHEEWLSFRSSRPNLSELQLSRSSVLYFPAMLKGVRDYGNDGLLSLEAVIDSVEAGEKGFLNDRESTWQTYLLLAELHYEHERFAEAENIVRRVMSQVEELQLTFIYFIGAALLVKIIRAVHNPGEIDALTKRLEAMIMENGHIFLLPNFHAFELRNRLEAGQAGFTEVFEIENREYENKPYFFLIYRHFTFVRGLLSLGYYSRAMLILGNLELLCRKYKRPTDLIEVNILKATALYHLGYEDDACRHLMDAITASERYGFIRMFSDEAKDILPVLDLARKQTRSKYIQSIIISCKKTLARAGYKPPEKKYLHIELTKTELKILRAVQSGLSYTEIAQDNGIRMSTVKSHLHSIYSKLEVSNKTAAVIAAQELGILK